MTFGVDDFARRSDLLISASEEFQDSLAGDEADQDRAIEELLGAAKPAESAILGLVAQPALPPLASSVTDDLASVLLELQSGNLLVAAGLERRELPRDAGLGTLDLAREQIATARAEITAPAPTLGLAAKLNIQSATLDSAKGAFRNHSHQFLGEIVDEVQGTIKSAFDGLPKLGIHSVDEALGEMGKSVPYVADLGRLIRRGVESIKRALDALGAFIGSDAIGKIKAELGELWAKLGKGGKAVLEPLLGVGKVQTRIEEILSSTALGIAGVDRATNALAPLSGNFVRESKLLRFLVNGIALAARLLTLVHVAAPWVPLAIGAAYFTAIGAVLVVGGDYTGGRRLLGRIEGVEQVAEHMQAA